MRGGGCCGAGEVKLSVVIPCYNVERWVPRCLDEVIAALPSDGELIAVDDGSTDSTRTILRERAAREPRMKVVEAAHGGLSSARNHGLDAACGEYIFFVDADDGVAPDFFTAMIGAMERDQADCCVCAVAEQVDGQTEVRPGKLKGDYRFATNAEIIAGYLSRIIGYSLDDVRAWYAGRPLFAPREMAAVWRMVYRRDLIEAHHLRFDEEVAYFEDMVFNLGYLLVAHSMTCVDRSLYRVTYRPSGLTGTFPSDGLRYCRNKLTLLERRNAVNRRMDGALAPLYAGSCVFSALEILSYIVRRRVPFREGCRILRRYLGDPVVRDALASFPLSIRHPLIALAVLAVKV